MRDLLVIGVLTVLLAGSGEAYKYKCDDSTVAAITQSVQPSNNMRKWPAEDILATTANYFDAMLSGITDPSNFLCANTVVDQSDDKLMAIVRYKASGKPGGLGMKFDDLEMQNGGWTFSKCDDCPSAIKSAKAYRFFQKDGVIGVYTCNTKAGAATGDKEGFIKVESIKTWSVDNGARKRTIPVEIKNVIEEAKEKAKTLGLVMNDAPIDCDKKSNSPAPAPGPTVPAPGPSPDKPSSFHRFWWLLLIVIAVVGTTTIIYTSR